MSKIFMMHFEISPFKGTLAFGSRLYWIVLLSTLTALKCLGQTLPRLTTPAEELSELTPFECDATQYQITSVNGTGGPSTLYTYRGFDSSRKPIMRTDNYLNALAFNPKDGLLYGLNRYGILYILGLNEKHFRFNIVQFEDSNDGTVHEYFVGDITDDGYYYIYKGSGNQFWILDVDPSRSSYLRLVRPNGVAIQAGTRSNTMNLSSSGFISGINIDDWAYNPKKRLFYGILGGSTAGGHGNKMVTMDRDGVVMMEGAVTHVEGGFNNYRSTWGASFFDNEQNFWAVANGNGRFYRIDSTRTVTGWSQAGEEVSKNDGAGCALAGPTQLDYGDAPRSYRTTFSGDSLTAHIITSKLSIGSLTDADFNGFPSVLADGDDKDATNDEDGIEKVYRQVITGNSFSVPVKVKNTLSTAATLAGWIDWNRNGTFDTNERVVASVPVNAESAVLTWVTPEGVTMLENFYMRLRLASATSDLINAHGLASDGEVEDHLIGISHDYGDAPDSYGTMLNSNGARHLNTVHLAPQLRLGTLFDVEVDGQSTPDFNGDNANGINDEDGLGSVLSYQLTDRTFSLDVKVTNKTKAKATLAGWIDFNKDGKFGTQGTEIWTERATVLVDTGATTAKLTWTGLVPGLALNKNNLRLRIASNASEVASPVGPANDGEVEDHIIDVPVDMGDAPESYGTLLKDDGPRHALASNLMIGTRLDVEADGQPTVLANGDDNQEIDDEDGIDPILAHIIAGTTYSLDVKVTNTTGAPATLVGWIDFNKNGRFDAEERVMVPVPNLSSSVKLNWPGLAPGLEISKLYLRLRLASNVNEMIDSKGGASNGEVEDHLIGIDADYGDAPESYGTLLKDDGPRHAPASNLMIGTRLDVEADGQPTVLANGDDNQEIDDEDGIDPILAHIITGTTYSLDVKVTNTTGAPATLVGWIDFNKNGRFDAEERVMVPVPNLSSSVKLNWPGLAPGLEISKLYLRLRLASNVNEMIDSKGGASNGEVEDHLIGIDADYGDAPESYGTLFKDKGPSHGIVSGLRLGATVDAELDGLPNALASGSKDDDGVVFENITEDQVAAGLTSYSITANVTNTTGKTANVIAWIDWNKNGLFDASESAAGTVASSGAGAKTTGVVTLNWTGVVVNVSDPNNVNIFMRVRVATDAIGAADTGGDRNDGEVEDYQLYVGGLPVTLISFTAQKGDDGIALRWKTSSEVDFSHFEVERSGNGRNYSKLGTVGSLSGEYNFKDLTPANGHNYYRLKMIDLDGTYAYSSVQSVDYKGAMVYVYPNPVSTYLFMNGVNVDDVMQVEIINATGLIVYKSNIFPETGISVKHLNKGIYQIRIAHLNGVVDTQRVIVNN